MSLHDTFAQKLQQEFEAFKQNLLTQTPFDVLYSAHELVVKENIVDYLVNTSFENDGKLAFLLENDYDLDDFYNEYLSQDIHLGGVIETSVDYTLDKLNIPDEPAVSTREPSTMAEILQAAQAKADKINAQNALAKTNTPTKPTPQIGD